MFQIRCSNELIYYLDMFALQCHSSGVQWDSRTVVLCAGTYSENLKTEGEVLG